jgi:hypothetical protein
VSVLRDGVEQRAASLGIAVPVDPGKHEIVLRAPGHTESRVSVTVAEGENTELALELGAPLVGAGEVSSGTSERPPAQAGGSSQKTLGFVLGGVGVAGIATGIVAGALVLDRKSKVESECDGNQCSHAGVEAASSGRTWSTVSTVAFAAGAVGVGVGLYLVLSAKPEPETARVELVTLPGAAALNLRGAF